MTAELIGTVVFKFIAATFFCVFGLVVLCGVHELLHLTMHLLFDEEQK